MRLRLSLQIKFIISVVLLFVVLIVLILFVIEQRERKAIFEEQRSKGILVAKNIAQLNLRPLFVLGDRTGVEKNIEKEISPQLLYIVFYSRDNEPVVAKSYAQEFEELSRRSHLGDEASRETYFFQRKNLSDPRSGKVFRVLEIEIPLFLDGSARKWGSVKIGHSLEEMYAENAKTRLMLVLIGAGVTLIGILGAIVLAKRITGPLTKLVEATVNISRGDFTPKIEIDSRDEIGDLAQSFKEMSGQLQLTRNRMEEANKKLIQAEKLASIGRISASIAHEIRNPLTSVKLNIQKILENPGLGEIEKAHLDISWEGIGQIENFVKEMLDFTRVSKLNLDQFPMEQIIEDSAEMLADSLEEKKINLDMNFKEGIPQVVADGDKLRQVFLNLLRNACEAVDEGGTIAISLSPQEKKGKLYVRAEISDDGSGIPEGDWENIFEPFYTTKSLGIGLGLANAKKIVESHSGSIRVIKKEGKGSAFEILIPAGGEK